MKLIGFILGLFLMFNCFAAVEAEIVAKDIDANGNIRVWTQYKIDGVEVVSQYPKIDGKSVYATRYNAMNFYGMTDQEIKDRIVADAEQHTETLIKKTYNEVKNLDILDKNLSTLVGSKVLKECVITVIGDKTVTIKTDGSSSEKVIISP